MSSTTLAKFETSAHAHTGVGFCSRADSRKAVAAIAGTGLITPLGVGVDETWRALLAGRYIEDHARSAGEFDRPAPRVVQMARRAAGEASTAARWSDDAADAVIVGTSKGSIESWIDSKDTGAAGGPNPAGLGDIASELARPGAIRLTLSGACASGLMALTRGAMMIESGQARRVLVVAAEASVHPLFIGSFQRLGVLPKQGVGCRPFDLHRDGFLMSEAAAAVCLEARDAVNGQGGDDASETVVVERYAMGADGAHLTAGDPDGRVLRHLIERVAGGQLVDLVHAHGTGTPTNDPIELAAIEAALHDVSAGARVYSHKGALGHSLGAAGLVSVVLNHRCHVEGIIPGNVRTTHPLPTRHVRLSAQPQGGRIERSVATAAGFGGAIAVVGLARR